MTARWQNSGNSLDHLDEWGLGGRKFGSWITWFLVGGDLYTAYTFVAVPALLFGAGAMGFFALPYTVILYPLVFLPVLRLWSVSRVHGYVTPADFVRGRYGSPLLALLVAITGLVATMPYIALQLVGMEAVLRTMGLNATGIAGHLPLLIELIERGRQAGRFRADLEPRFAALSLLSLCMFPFVSRLVTEPMLGIKYEGAELERYIDHTARLFLAGIEHRPQEPA